MLIQILAHFDVCKDGEFCHAPYKYKVRCAMHPTGAAALIFCPYLCNVGK